VVERGRVPDDGRVVQQPDAAEVVRREDEALARRAVDRRDLGGRARIRAAE
jgi:hypothetical protein